jgi:hypothetical protein
MEDKMLSLEEIQNCEKININIVREAFMQAEKRLNDILDTKKQFEQKAFTLFSGYLTGTIGLFTIAVTLFNEKSKNNLFMAFIISGILLLVGSIFLSISLKGFNYGYLGSTPRMWLKKYIIEGDEKSLSTMLSYITHYHQNRIDKSLNSNKIKTIFIDLGILFGIIALIVFVIMILFYNPLVPVPPSS